MPNQIKNGKCVSCTAPSPVLRDNCKNQCCDGFLPQPVSQNLKYHPALVKKIYDCMDLTSPMYCATLAGVEFKVTPAIGALGDGDIVCIEEIGFDFDCIGLGTGANGIPAIDGYADGKEIGPFTGVYSPCLAKNPAGTGNVPLYTKIEATIPAISCCPEEGEEPKTGVNVVIAETNVDPYIEGFKVIAKGKITKVDGTTYDFTAEHTPANGRLSVLFPSIGKLSFCGEMCIPAEKEVVINDTFDFNGFEVKCINNTTEYVMANNGFNANVFLCYQAKKSVYTLVEEKMAVVYDADQDPVCPQSNLCDNIN